MASRRKKKSGDQKPGKTRAVIPFIGIAGFIGFICLILGAWIGRTSAVRESVKAAEAAQLDSLAAGMANTGLQFAPCPPEITTLITGKAFKSSTETIDFVREYVYGNSVHKIDREWKKYARDTSKVLTMLHQHDAAGGSPPHLSCGPRAMAMGAILNSLGIKARVVHIFTTEGSIDSHTFLDVFNDDLNSWELQDPDFDIYYCWQDNNTRLSTLQIVLGDVDAAEPHSARGVGWETNKVDHLRRAFFGAVMHDYRRLGERSLIVINTDRFEPNLRFPAQGNLNFFEFAKTRYKQPLVLTSKSAIALESVAGK